MESVKMLITQEVFLAFNTENFIKYKCFVFCALSVHYQKHNHLYFTYLDLILLVFEYSELSFEPLSIITTFFIFK